jgi:hypothetical protein
MVKHSHRHNVRKSPGAVSATAPSGSAALSDLQIAYLPPEDLHPPISSAPTPPDRNLWRGAALRAREETQREGLTAASANGERVLSHRLGIAAAVGCHGHTLREMLNARRPMSQNGMDRPCSRP